MGVRIGEGPDDPDHGIECAVDVQVFLRGADILGRRRDGIAQRGYGGQVISDHLAVGHVGRGVGSQRYGRQCLACKTHLRAGLNAHGLFDFQVGQLRCGLSRRLQDHRRERRHCQARPSTSCRSRCHGSPSLVYMSPNGRHRPPVQPSMAEPVRPCHRLDGFCGYVDESWLSTAIHTLLCPVLHPLLYWFVRGVRKRTPFGQKGPYGLQYD